MAGEGGVKYDGEKARFDLLPPSAIKQIAEVYTMGAKKYADRNWEKGIKWGRIYAAAQRHLHAFWDGEDNDPESGLCHLAHAAWGILALLVYKTTHPELDDRSKPQRREGPNDRREEVLFRKLEQRYGLKDRRVAKT